MPVRWTPTLERIAATCIAVAALACTLLPATTRADDNRAPAAAPTNKARLDLTLGDMSRYLDPAEMAMPLNELEEIIVRGRKPPKLPEQRIIPMGLGALVYAAKNPLQSWRILVPDPNVTIPLRDADEVREPPGAFRGQMFEPGRIF